MSASESGYDESMKKLLAIVILSLFLITPSQADDIRDFQIEGISIGDSTLNYMDKKNKLKRPDYWGGYIVKVVSFEFWQGRPNRLHDRILYTQENNYWIKSRLSP